MRPETMLDQGESKTLPQPTGVFEIEYSRDDFLAWAYIGILFTLGTVVLALVSRSLMEKIILYVCAAYFAPTTINNYLWPVFSSRDPVLITMTPEGIRDVRVGFIPWKSIARISTYSYRGIGFGRSMILTLKPGATKELSLTWFGRLTRIVNFLVGVNGVQILAMGLKMNYEKLLNSTLTYARTYNPQIAMSV